MASVTARIAEFAGGSAYVEIVYDDVSLAISRVQATNNGDRPLVGWVSKAGTVLRSISIAAGANLGRNLPNGVKYLWLDDGDGLGFNLSLGDLQIGAGYG